MRTVGIVGDNSDDLVEAFKRMRYDGINFVSSGFDKNGVVCADNIVSMDALIAQDAKPILFKALASLDRKAFLILNSDKKEILPFLAERVGAFKLITYGFNNKACVTASSNMDGVLQACVQRGFVSLDGRSYEPGEFDFPLGERFAEKDAALGLAAACLVCGCV